MLYLPPFNFFFFLEGNKTNRLSQLFKEMLLRPTMLGCTSSLMDKEYGSFFMLKPGLK